MNDFPDLLPPPPRDLTPEQRDRLRARLPLEDDQSHGRPWWVSGAAAAAAVVLVVGGAVGLSRMVGKGSEAQPSTHVGHGNPLSLPASGGVDCLAGAPRTVVVINTVTPTRDVTLAGASLTDVTGTSIGGSWVATVERNRGPQSGEFQEGLPGMPASLGWQNRFPMAGAVLQQGSTYRLFVRVTMVNGAQFSGVRYSFTDAGTPGSAVAVETVQAKHHC